MQSICYSWVKTNPIHSSFGMITVGRTWHVGSEYRYGFGGHEEEDEISGNNSNINFGARIYNSRLGVFLSVDAFSNINQTYSPYVFADDNPILFIDYNGNFRMSARQQRRYPQLTNILIHIQQTATNDPQVYNAFKETLKLTDDECSQILEWGKGPKVSVKNFKIAYAGTIDQNNIILDKKGVKMLEGYSKNTYTNTANGLVAFYYSVVLHEAQHIFEERSFFKRRMYAPYIPDNPKHEAGLTFELKAFGGIISTNRDNNFKGMPLIAPFAKSADVLATQLSKPSSKDTTVGASRTGGKDAQNYSYTFNKPESISDQLGVDTAVQK